MAIFAQARASMICKYSF